MQFSSKWRPAASACASHHFAPCHPITTRGAAQHRSQYVQVESLGCQCYKNVIFLSGVAVHRASWWCIPGYKKSNGKSTRRRKEKLWPECKTARCSRFSCSLLWACIALLLQTTETTQQIAGKYVKVWWSFAKIIKINNFWKVAEQLRLQNGEPKASSLLHGGNGWSPGGSTARAAPKPLLNNFSKWWSAAPRPQKREKTASTARYYAVCAERDQWLPNSRTSYLTVKSTWKCLCAFRVVLDQLWRSASSAGMANDERTQSDVESDEEFEETMTFRFKLRRPSRSGLTPTILQDELTTQLNRKRLDRIDKILEVVVANQNSFYSPFWVIDNF